MKKSRIIGEVASEGGRIWRDYCIFQSHSWVYYLHEHLAYNDVIIIFEHSAEDDSHTISLSINIPTKIGITWLAFSKITKYSTKLF